MSNDEMVRYWNEGAAPAWTRFEDALDAQLAPLGARARERAGLRGGERVLDVGCGCGSTSLQLARTVGPQGSVLGVDISRPMLQAAQRRADAEPALRVTFTEADASAAALPADHDLLYSRFGLMFFDAPAAALRHLRGALRPGGRCAFVCWRAPRDNPWAMAPLMAARQALGINPPPADPLMPGPFAFADEQRLRSLMTEAGFAAVDVQRFDAPAASGASAREAAQNSLQIGPVSRLAREVGPAHTATLLDAIDRALAPLAAADGSIALAGSTWVVTARNG